MPHSQVVIEQSPFISPEAEGQWHYGERGKWPCSWIEPSTPVVAPFVAAYRLKFWVETAAMVRVHVTADERYALFLDGELIGRGSQRGDREHWFFESYDLDFEPGEHVLVARVSSLGSLAEIAQMSVQHGFLLATEYEWIGTLGTGHADWEAQVLDGLTFSKPAMPGYYYACGPVAEVDAAHFPWGYQTGKTGVWQAAHTSLPAIDGDYASESPLVHGLQPATLPPQTNTSFALDGYVSWQSVASKARSIWSCIARSRRSRGGSYCGITERLP